MAMSKTLVDVARWRSSRALLAGGLGLALAVLVAALGLLKYQRDVQLEQRRANNDILARVLEDHATRAFETTALAMASLEVLLSDPRAGQRSAQPSRGARQPATARPSLEADGAPQALARLEPAMKQALVGLPHVRSMALLDADGQVLASTSVREQGRKTHMGLLEPLPTPGTDRIGSYRAGRSLADVLAGSAVVAPQGVGYIPMLRAVSWQAERAYLVALVNPDALANFQQLTLADEKRSAVLASYAGVVLAATQQSRALPGHSVAQLPVFTSHLAHREHHSYTGPGVQGERQILAYRASRSRPLVVIVEQSEEQVVSELLQASSAFLALALLGMAVIVGLTLLAVRSAREREQARGMLDDAQGLALQRERELSVVVGSVQELLFRTDAAGVLTFANRRWEAMTGRPMHRVLGLPLRELCVAADIPTANALFEPAQAEELRHCQLSFQGIGGQPRRFDVAVLALHDGQALQGFAGSAVDVTERLDAQGRLREQLQLTELLLDASPLPMQIVDANGVLQRVNQAWEEFTGRAGLSVLGRSVASILAPEHAAAQHEQNARVLRTGQRLDYPLQVPNGKGVMRDLLVVKVRVPAAQGQGPAVLATFVDVTELREAERATLAARDAAQQASQAKTDFIANISHELRTPLQSILGFSELGAARGSSHPGLVAMFNDIHRSGQRMLALVNDLLDVSKIESREAVFHMARADLCALAQEVAQEMQPLLLARRLSLELALPAQPLVALVDKLRVQQVLRNVLANAVKFSPDGRAIVLAVRRVETTGSGPQVQVSVADHGPGIPPGELEHIFEAFVQSSRTKDGSGGTGLGLAICRRILQAHGGHIEAANQAQGGSVFTIHLPLADLELAALA